MRNGKEIMLVKDTPKIRSRKYLLTINNPAQHNLSHNTISETIDNSKIAVRYYAVCDETGSQGTYHFHVFLYFKNAIDFQTIKGMFPQAHIDIAKGTAEECKAYLLKSNKKHNKADDGSYQYKDTSGKTHSGVNHSDTFEEHGECPKDHAGARNDLEQLYNYVKDGLTNAEIVELMPKTGIKYLDKINRLRHDYLEDKYKNSRRLDLKVHYIFGKTGTGKTRDILDQYADSEVYRVTDAQHPFDSYKQQSVIVYEEFRSSLRLQDMLNYLDIYPVDLPARYSPKVCCAETIFVVSNWTFEMQYAELQKDPEQKASYEAWVRRFNGEVREYTDSGIKVYKTMQEYLHRDTDFVSLDESVELPFD